MNTKKFIKLQFSFIFIIAILLLNISKAYSQEYGNVSGIVTNLGVEEVSVLIKANPVDIGQLNGTMQLTDKNGNYNIKLETGEYEISAELEDGRLITKFINVLANTNTSLDFIF